MSGREGGEMGGARRLFGFLNVFTINTYELRAENENKNGRRNKSNLLLSQRGRRPRQADRREGGRGGPALCIDLFFLFLFFVDGQRKCEL